MTFAEAVNDSRRKTQAMADERGETMWLVREDGSEERFDPSPERIERAALQRLVARVLSVQI